MVGREVPWCLLSKLLDINTVQSTVFLVFFFFSVEVRVCILAPFVERVEQWYMQMRFALANL
jgi:hypothetical protein